MAFTSVPAAGAKLRASVLLSLINELRPLSAYQVGTSTAVNNSTALVSLSGFSLPVVANATYRFMLYLRYRAATAADLKIGWTFPSGLTMAYGMAGIPAGGAAYTWVDYNQTSTPTFEGAGVGVQSQAFGSGAILVSSTAGDLQLQYAQGTANVSDATIRDGAQLVAWRVS